MNNEYNIIDLVNLNPIVLGNARAFLKKHGKYKAQSITDLTKRITKIYRTQKNSKIGEVFTLCISPIHGSRHICNTIYLKQSIIGDCQSHIGIQNDNIQIKNNNQIILEENIFIESLLTAVSISDYKFVKELVHELKSPRINKVWVTGDNVYIKNLDMSWYNFRIGDLLVMPNVIILNTGYPHFACWKYAVRTCDNTKEYVNSKNGTNLRVRGIKGAVLHLKDNKNTTISTTDSVFIIHKNTSEYNSILQKCKPPINTELNYTSKFNEKIKASPGNIYDYVKLLITAGLDAARVDAYNYNRKFIPIICHELNIDSSKL